jgi:hypothetical protein
MKEVSILLPRDERRERRGEELPAHAHSAGQPGGYSPSFPERAVIAVVGAPGVQVGLPSQGQRPTGSPRRRCAALRSDAEHVRRCRRPPSGLDQRRNVSGRTGETPVSSCTRARSSAALLIGAGGAETQMRAARINTDCGCDHGRDYERHRGKFANLPTTQEPRVASARHRLQ